MARPKSDDRRIKITVRLPSSLLERVDDVGTRTEVIEAALRGHLGEPERVDEPSQEPTRSKGPVASLDIPEMK